MTAEWDFFELLAKSLTAKSWGEELESDGVQSCGRRPHGAHGGAATGQTATENLKKFSSLTSVK
jgi:hypothetical protein